MIVEFKNVGLKIGEQKILCDINFSLEKGKINTFIGPNGGGKTSIVRLLIGVITPTSGKIFKGKKVKIGYMPQKIELNSVVPLRVLDFLRLSCKISEDELVNFIERFFSCKKDNALKILQMQIHDLSGGQLQKILFLRAIIDKPDLLVLDEPTQYMDINGVKEFYHMVDEIRRENNCAILLVSHDLVAVMKRTDFVYCINRHICCHGAPESVNKHPEYLALFGGEDSELAVYKHQHDHNH